MDIPQGNAGPLYYIVRRSPRFDTGDLVVLSTEYLDSSVKSDVTYGYEIKAANDAGEAPFFTKIQTEYKKSSGEKELSPATVAGIAVASVIVAGALAGLAVYLLKGRRTKVQVNLHHIT